MNNTKLSVIVWNEFDQEGLAPAARATYPNGVHAVIANCLRRALNFNPDAVTIDVTTATQDEPDHGLCETRLLACDVLVWCGSLAQDLVADEVVDRIHRRVLEGMGLIVLHAGLASKIFRKLLGVNWSLEKKSAGKKERLSIVDAMHPIAAGVGKHFDLPAGEMYRENFDMIQPDSTVFVSKLHGGDTLRSGCCWARGFGRLFYFRPGDLAHPTFHNPNVQRILANAVQWVAPRFRFNDSHLDAREPGRVDNERSGDNPANALRIDRAPPYLVGSKFMPTPVKLGVGPGTVGSIGATTESQPLFPTLLSHLQGTSGCGQKETGELRHRLKRRLIA